MMMIRRVWVRLITDRIAILFVLLNDAVCCLTMFVLLVLCDIVVYMGRLEDATNSIMCIFLRWRVLGSDVELMEEFLLRRIVV